MGILSRVAVKAAKASAEKSSTKPAKSAVGTTKAGEAGTAHALNKALPKEPPPKSIPAEGESGQAATRKADANVAQARIEQPDRSQNGSKSALSPSGMAGGTLLTASVAVALCFAVYRKLKALRF